MKSTNQVQRQGIIKEIPYISPENNKEKTINCKFNQNLITYKNTLLEFQINHIENKHRYKIEDACTYN